MDNNQDRRDLKHADMDKFGAQQLNSAGADNSELLRREKKAREKKMRGEESIERKKSKKIPLGVDIAVAILILAIAGALIFGMYFILKSQAPGYTDKNIEYTILVAEKDANGLSPEIIKGKNVYFDTNGNALYFGKVKEAEILEGEDGKTQIIAKISVATQYKSDEGYLISDNRIAMGCQYSLRIEQIKLSATIVEMKTGGGK